MTEAVPTVKTGLGEGNRQFDVITFRWDRFQRAGYPAQNEHTPEFNSDRSTTGRPGPNGRGACA
jgi:hypothetical protein